MFATTKASRARSCAPAAPCWTVTMEKCRKFMTTQRTRRIWRGKRDEFYGVGPVTVDIFLRELSPFWKKADPDRPSAVQKMARRLRRGPRRLRSEKPAAGARGDRTDPRPSRRCGIGAARRCVARSC